MFRGEKVSLNSQTDNSNSVGSNLCQEEDINLDNITEHELIALINAHKKYL